MAQSRFVLPVQALGVALRPGKLEIGTACEKSGVIDTAKNNNPNG